MIIGCHSTIFVIIGQYIVLIFLSFFTSFHANILFSMLVSFALTHDHVTNTLQLLVLVKLKHEELI